MWQQAKAKFKSMFDPKIVTWFQITWRSSCGTRDSKNILASTFGLKLLNWTLYSLHGKNTTFFKSTDQSQKIAFLKATNNQNIFWMVDEKESLSLVSEKVKFNCFFYFVASLLLTAFNLEKNKVFYYILTAFWHSKYENAYENQVYLAQIVHKTIIGISNIFSKW